jgi:hypothetical protein
MTVRDVRTPGENYAIADTQLQEVEAWLERRRQMISGPYIPSELEMQSLGMSMRMIEAHIALAQISLTDIGPVPHRVDVRK